MGQSPLSMGWKHKFDDNFIHYQIQGDELSNGSFLGSTKDKNHFKLTKRGGINNADENALLLHRHGLHNFYNRLYLNEFLAKYKSK